MSGAYDYVTKPAHAWELEWVAKAAEKSRLRRENVSLRVRLQSLDANQGLITEDPAMKELLATVERVAASDIPVLIQGESGTGKELVARAVHRLSPRGSQAFVAINCGAVPETLMESELFGTRRAPSRSRSFQDAFSRWRPRVLFLDEVARSRLLVQVSPARDLGNEFSSGGTRGGAHGLRLVSASNKN